MIFLCEYEINMAATNAQNLQTLQTNQGGKLGLVGMSELDLTAQDLKTADTQWSKLLSPVRGDMGVWKFDSGPAMKVVEGAESELQAVVLRVRSLDVARAFLKQAQLIGTDDRNKITLDLAATHGLTIQLSE
jgi:hypothetical protein